MTIVMVQFFPALDDVNSVFQITRNFFFKW